MSGVRKLLVFFLLTSFIAVAPAQGFGDSWQQPRKQPEVIREKEKQKQDGKGQGNDRRKEEPKKKDEKKKPYF